MLSLIISIKPSSAWLIPLATAILPFLFLLLSFALKYCFGRSFFTINYIRAITEWPPDVFFVGFALALAGMIGKQTNAIIFSAIILMLFICAIIVQMFTNVAITGIRRGAKAAALRIPFTIVSYLVSVVLLVGSIYYVVLSGASNGN